jgi:hypothetical protein
VLPDVILVPEQAHFSLKDQSVSWTAPDGRAQRIRLLASKTYLRPGGYRVHLEADETDPSRWRLVGTLAEGLVCHKPCTVSGGGKSEISKAITDAIMSGSVFVADFDKDMDAVAAILVRDYADRFRTLRGEPDRRPILSPDRSFGSVIKLLTPSAADYTDAIAFAKSVWARRQ